ncbi:hypothetical protein MUK42_35487 [Musa troglodytarum]|uniref:Uncharacterized protein n=1 Tax=Musa troglodytarum TaxID=320322 RepID=A0A9E7GUG1_9LILI|nr:hypothetical protein MUK42_35487 [Musa troglodytarum]
MPAGCDTCRRSTLSSPLEAIATAIMTMSATATAIGTWVLLWRSIDRQAEGTKMQIVAVTSLVWVAISTLMLLAVVVLLVYDSCLAFESLAMVRRRPRDGAANDEEAVALDIYGQERRRR